MVAKMLEEKVESNVFGLLQRSFSIKNSSNIYTRIGNSLKSNSSRFKAINMGLYHIILNILILNKRRDAAMLLFIAFL